jgi:uncharacterized protein YndB with AHSA1/START domain
MAKMELILFKKRGVVFNKMDTTITTKFKIFKPANEVFEAIADPDKMSNFWFSSGTDRIAEGKTITWRYDEYDAEGIVHVLEVIQDKKIVFTWGEQGQQTKVIINLHEDDSPGTTIEVIESGLREDDPEIVNKMVGQKGGWVYMLSCLKAYLENDVSTLRASLLG